MTIHRLHSAARPVLMHAKNLCVYYENCCAISDVDLPLHKNAITALVGPSGCGKTSLLSCFNRMNDSLQGCKVSGTLDAFGEDALTMKDPTALRKRVGMIFQRPNPFPLSIEQNLIFPLKENGFKKSERKERAHDALKAVGLFDEVKHRLTDSALALSGGQQQRLCFARALCLEPDVLLLDEPCSQLDPLASALVEDLVMSLKERVTILVVTHNLAQAKRIADYVGMFWVEGGSGTLVEFGECEQVLTDPQHELTKAYVSGSRG